MLTGIGNVNWNRQLAGLDAPRNGVHRDLHSFPSLRLTPTAPLSRTHQHHTLAAIAISAASTLKRTSRYLKKRVGRMYWMLSSSRPTSRRRQDREQSGHRDAVTLSGPLCQRFINEYVHQPALD